MKYNPPVYNVLEKYAQSTVSRFHMPGHGGRAQEGFLGDVYRYDVTELSETDDLACPTGVIAEAQRLAAEKFGANGTLFSCHGATLCIQAAIYASLMLKPRGRIYCHRKVHKSVVNAFVLLDIEPVWFCDEDTDFSHCDAVIYTHTDYHGDIFPCEKLYSAAKRYGFLLIADNAHGSHLAFMDGGRLHPVKMGADFCIDSLHKTLAVLTGGACLNIKNPQWSALCRRGMTLFGSTSPNYLIMASIDKALSCVSGDVLDRTRLAVEAVKKRHPSFFYDNGKAHDPLRMTLRCEKPHELYTLLYEKGIKCEFYDACGVVLIPPYGADEQYFAPLEEVLCGYDSGNYDASYDIKYKVPQKACAIRKAAFSPSQEIDIICAEGRISAGEYSLYPPGIPLIVPGEIFTKELINCLKDSFDKVKILN